MIAHSAALRYIFARKITAAEHSALSYTVKRGGAGGGVLRTVLTVSVNRKSKETSASKDEMAGENR